MDPRLDKLIKLLDICPKCLSGYIRPYKFSTQELSGRACYPPSYDTIIDTTLESVVVKCTNCPNSVTFINDNYLRPKVIDESVESGEDNLDLFG